MSDRITSTLKVIVYARAGRQDCGAGLDHQVTDLLGFAAGNGWDDVTVIGEVSARPTTRAMEVLRTADIVIVRSPDRLSRSMQGLLSTVSALNANGARVLTPDGELLDRPPLIGVRAVRAAAGTEAEATASPSTVLSALLRELHSERTRRGMAAATARREGWQ